MSNEKPAGLLHSLPIPNQPWELVRIHFMGPLLRSNGHDYAMVVIDRITSEVQIIPMTMKLMAKGATEQANRSITQVLCMVVQTD